MMKFFLFLVMLLSLLVISSLYISKEDGSLDSEVKKIKHSKKISIEELYTKFKNMDMNSKEFDLDKAITDIKKARDIYPLDDKLKMIDIELEHKKVNSLSNN